MRTILAATVLVLSVAATQAGNDVTFNASELRNVWRTCDVSGRARAAKVRCVNEQAEKLAQGKTIQRTNAQAEAATREQIGAPHE